MASTSQQPVDRVVPTLDVLIQVLNIATHACGIPPAQIAFGSASVLLVMIRVRFSPYDEDKLLTPLPPGYDGQRSRLH